MRDGCVFTSVIIYVVLKGLVCFNVVFICCMLFLTVIFRCCIRPTFLKIYILVMYKFILYVGLETSGKQLYKRLSDVWRKRLCRP